MTGVDPAVASLDAAREHARSTGLLERLTFVEGDAYDLSMFPEGCFDGVVMADVLEHLYDLPAAVAQAWRVLRPGGVLVFDTVNRTFASYVLAIAVAQEGLRMVPSDTHDWRLFVQPQELAFLLQASGFLVDVTQFRGMAPTFRLQRPFAGAVRLARALRAGAPPPMPISDFVEVASLEVQYLGWALKPASESGDTKRPRPFAPGELSDGLREYSRAR